MFELTTEQPLGYVLLCILLGLLYASALYYKERGLPGPAWLKPLLAALRGLLVAFLAFLLLTPLIRTFSREVEKPLVVLAQDNSESIVDGSDSSAMRGAYSRDMLALADRLRSSYDVHLVTWGDVVKEASSFTFREKVTDISGLLDDLDTRYANRNLGALVLASDGLYNRGGNPLYHSALQVPYYIVALGDTIVRKDTRIGDARYNRTAYLGNSFPVEVSVDVRQAAGSQVTLEVSEDSTVIFSRAVKVTNNRFTQPVTALIDAAKKGMHHYRLSVSHIPGETTYSNNERDIYVEVKESKEKILIVALAPHPDVAALKQALEANQNYEVKTVMADGFDGKTDGYALVVFHQLPSDRFPMTAVISRLSAAGISTWYILGSGTSLPLFNKTGAGLSIASALDKTNAATAALNPDFSYFNLGEETARMLPALPPLTAPFGDYRMNGAGSAVLFQQIGNVATHNPLLVVGGDNVKTAVLAGEGYWRWRLADFAANDNFQATQEIAIKTVQYLSAHEQKSRFRLTHKSTFPENEPVLFDAEVYNESYELINTPDVNLVIRRHGDSFPFTFSKTDKAYTLNAGYFQPGEYSYKATVKAGEKMLVQEGVFTIAALQQELSETTADHALLRAMAAKSGGRVFDPGQLQQLGDTLLKKELKPVSYSGYTLRDLIHLKSVFFLLLALLTIEWFARKRAGGY